MERPKVTRQPIKRAVTGEVVYFDDMWRARQVPEPYKNVSDMARQAYEEAAALYVAQGARPEIMDTYETYDAEFSDLYVSCAAFADELLALKDPDETVTFVDVVVESPAKQVLEQLRETSIGRLLAADDRQLAGAADPRYKDLDIKKRDATLTGVRATVFGRSSDGKYFILGKDEVSPLIYPSGEQNKWYQVELSFSYRHTSGERFSEKMVLSLGTQGDMSINTSIYIDAYAEQGYEGGDGRFLYSPTDEEVTQFVDLVAEVIGDEPLSVRQWYDRDMALYLNLVVLPKSVEYVHEWLTNSWSGQVRGDLLRIPCGDTSLAKGLADPLLAEQAHKQLVDLIERKRAERNAASLDTSMSKYIGDIDPWQDLVVR